MKLEDLINRAGDMKVLPSAARKVMEMVERDDVSGNQLADYRALRETLDLVDHPAIGFLDIPTASASELVTELQEAFAKEATYWVH